MSKVTLMYTVQAYSIRLTPWYSHLLNKGKAAMDKETDKFIVKNVEPILTESREISAVRRPPSKTGVRSADVYCKSCGNTWRARYRDGSLDNVVGGVLFICPQCRADERVTGLLA
jgi:hypothetical protein